MHLCSLVVPITDATPARPRLSPVRRERAALRRRLGLDEDAELEEAGYGAIKGLALHREAGALVVQYCSQEEAYKVLHTPPGAGCWLLGQEAGVCVWLRLVVAGCWKAGGRDWEAPPGFYRCWRASMLLGSARNAHLRRAANQMFVPLSSPRRIRR